MLNSGSTSVHHPEPASHPSPIIRTCVPRADFKIIFQFPSRSYTWIVYLKIFLRQNCVN